jgi:hypothetical protein
LVGDDPASKTSDKNHRHEVAAAIVERPQCTRSSKSSDSRRIRFSCWMMARAYRMKFAPSSRQDSVARNPRAPRIAPQQSDAVTPAQSARCCHPRYCHSCIVTTRIRRLHPVLCSLSAPRCLQHGVRVTRLHRDSVTVRPGRSGGARAWLAAWGSAAPTRTRPRPRAAGCGASGRSAWRAGRSEPALLVVGMAAADLVLLAKFPHLI